MVKVSKVAQELRCGYSYNNQAALLTACEIVNDESPTQLLYHRYGVLLIKTPAAQLLAPRAARLCGIGAPQKYV